MSSNLIIDLETLGTREGAVVISLGATLFDFENGKNDFDSYIENGFHVKFDVKDQVRNYKRGIEDGTLAWWKEQSAEARKILVPSDEDASMLEGLEMFNAWLRASKYDFKNSYVWSRGTYFDFPKVESMYDQLNLKCGFNTWKIRDVRTFIDVLVGVDNGKYEPQNGTPRNFVPHDALHDAAMDAFRMVEIFRLNSNDLTDDDIPF